MLLDGRALLDVNGSFSTIACNNGFRSFGKFDGFVLSELFQNHLRVERFAAPAVRATPGDERGTIDVPADAVEGETLDDANERSNDKSFDVVVVVPAAGEAFGLDKVLLVGVC